MTSPIPTEGGMHTPGPWSIHPRTLLTVVALNGNRSVATCGGYYDSRHAGKTDAENQANARLIAAAPALLEAIDPETLEAIANEIDSFEHSARAASLRGIAKRQRAALALATGGEDVRR